MKHLFVCIILCIGAVSIATGSPLVTASQLRGFLGGRTGKLAYGKFDNPDDHRRDCRTLCYIDFSEEGLPEHTVATHYDENADVRNPSISPDGQWVAYNTLAIVGTGWDTKKIYICKLQDSAGKIYICDGAGPRFWTKPGTDELYLIFTDRGFEEGFQFWFPSASVNGSFGGSTYIVRLDKTMHPVGTPTVLVAYNCNGGRSKNGKWLFMSERATGTYEIDGNATATTSVIRMHQFGPADENDPAYMWGCNPSISPHMDDAAIRTLHLDLTHEGYWVTSVTGTTIHYDKPDNGEPLMDLPEWSNHPDFITYVGHVGTDLNAHPWNIYVARYPSGTELKVLQGNYYHQHLWVNTDAAGVGTQRRNKVQGTVVSGKSGGSMRNDTRTIRYFDLNGKQLRFTGANAPAGSKTRGIPSIAVARNNGRCEESRIVLARE
jgi:hypothetical protein